jgi:hypothetical protein
METEFSPAGAAVLKRNVLKMRTESNTISKPNRERIIFLVMVLQIKTKYINYSISLFKFIPLKQPKHEVQKSGHYRFHRADYPHGGDEWRDETFWIEGSC